MHSDKTTILARATQNRGSKSFRDAARRRSAGQSLIVTIIVLFILLFLGGVFIALIANNLRNTRRGVRVSAANRFSEAGIKYLDEQLMTSVDGADWRPAPDCLPGIAPCVNIPENDPDYFWLKPLELNPTSGEYEGGYTRINFGGPNASQSNLGGRALVRVSYRPYRTDVATGEYVEDLNGNGVIDKPAEVIAPGNADRTRRFIKLESVGRVGIVDPLDPTTYQNSEGKGLRRELIAYKALGLTESLRFITDKDKRRPVATLGTPDPVQERAQLLANNTAAGESTAGTLYGGQSYNAGTGQFTAVGGFAPNGTRLPDGNAQILNRPIYNVFQGGIRSNTDLTFYGINYLALDPRRGDSVSVAGAIHLNGVADGSTTLSPNNDQTKVYLTDSSTATVAVSALGGTTTAGNVFPSGSPVFNTFDGFVRDNPRGNETQDLPADIVNGSANNNLRAVPRLEPPVMDSVIGDNGLTRFRALTRDSAPLSTVDTGTQTGANPADTNVAVNINPRYAGAYGWGQNLYIPNAVDLPAFSESISNTATASQRAEWLTPRVGTGTGSLPGNNWSAAGIYTPPAVSMTFTPRYYALNQSTTAKARNRAYLRRPDSGRSAVTSRPLETVYRFSYDTTALATAPTVGEGAINAFKFAGYPVTKNANGVYEGDLVIFAEGDIRIKGTIGGYDPETGQTFVRHLTVVSNGTIYVDGSVLRDNISPQMAPPGSVMRAAKGKSTIALLAKNYVAVNPTQFLSPVDTSGEGENNKKSYFELAPDNKDQIIFTTTFAPVVTYNTTTGLANVGNVFNDAIAAQDLNRVPPYITDTANAPLTFLLSQASAGDEGTSAVLGINAKDATNLNYFSWNTASTTLVSGKNLAETFYGSAYNLNNPTDVGYLYPFNTYPLNTMATTGVPNRFELRHGGVAGITPPDPTAPPEPTDTSKPPSNYLVNAFGVVPLDIRIEALMYAQEGSFFVIPGAWFNPKSGDTFAAYLRQNKRDATADALFPFYGEPLDIRITMFGAITENLPAEIGDQSAWLQKWGWVPRLNGSTGLGDTAAPTYKAPAATFHGTLYNGSGEYKDGVGNGINYIYDPRLAAPYDAGGVPLRLNPNFAGVPANLAEPLPPMPRLPVAPGLLYYGDRPIR